MSCYLYKNKQKRLCLKTHLAPGNFAKALRTCILIQWDSKVNELVIYILTWMNPKNMLKEGKQSTEEKIHHDTCFLKFKS